MSQPNTYIVKPFIAMPCYNGDIHFQTSIAWHNAKSQFPNAEIRSVWTSATPFCFNQLFAQCVKTDCTHFVMIHSDIGVMENDWLPVMIGMMQKHGLDVISAVSPIKSIDGLTSTALDTREWHPRRFTLKEVHEEFPPVLTNKICNAMYGHNLLINTGLMVIDMAKVRPIWKELVFQFIDSIQRVLMDGQEVEIPCFKPEDWLMSRAMTAHGLEIGVTKAITVRHFGTNEFESGFVWGQLETDAQWRHEPESKAEVPGVVSNVPLQLMTVEEMAEADKEFIEPGTEIIGETEVNGEKIE